MVSEEKGGGMDTRTGDIFKGLSKEEKAKFEKKFKTHSEYTDEISVSIGCDIPTTNKEREKGKE